SLHYALPSSAARMRAAAVYVEPRRAELARLVPSRKHQGCVPVASWLKRSKLRSTGEWGHVPPLLPARGERGSILLPASGGRSVFLLPASGDRTAFLHSSVSPSSSSHVCGEASGSSCASACSRSARVAARSR